MIWFAVGLLGELVTVIVYEVQIDFISIGGAVGGDPYRGGGVKATEALQ